MQLVRTYNKKSIFVIIEDNLAVQMSHCDMWHHNSSPSNNRVYKQINIIIWCAELYILC